MCVNDANEGEVVLHVLHPMTTTKPDDHTSEPTHTHKSNQPETNQSQILPVAIAPAQASTIPSSLPIGQSDSLVVDTAKNVSESAKPVLSKTAIPPSHPASPTVMEELIIGAVKNNPPKIKALETYLTFGGSLDESLKPLLTELLLYSIEKEQWDCARVLIKIDLIKNDADINMKVIEKLKEPINRAVENNDSNTLKTYLNFYSSLNFCGNLDRKFKSLLTKQLLYLIENLENENLECACILIKNGAQVILPKPSAVALAETDDEDKYPAAELGKKLFIVALHQEHKEIIQILMDKLIESGGASKPFLGDDSVLSLAVRDKKRDSVEIIIQAFYKAGLNLNDYINTPNNGETPLMLAVRNEDKEMIRLLLGIKGTDEEVLIQACIAADRILLEAVKQGNEEMIKLLLKRAEANPTLLNKFLNECEEDNTVFTLAATSQKKHIGEVIIQATGQATGMNPNDFKILSETGQTPFMLAAMRGDEESVKLMIKGTDPTLLQKLFSHLDKNGDNVFTLAAKNRKKNILEMLIQTLKIANVDLYGPIISNKNGETPLMLAAKNGDKESVELIIKWVGNSSGFLNMLLSKRDVNGDTVFALAAKNGKKNILEILIQTLKIANMNLDGLIISNKNGETPLMLAAKNGDKESVELIIKGYDNSSRSLNMLFSNRDVNGDTVLTFAAGNGEILEVLIQACIAADRMLLEEVRQGNEAMIKLLLKMAEANPKLLNKFLNECDEEGNTVFTLAAKNGEENIIEVLIQALIAADENPNSYLNVKNQQGHTPLMLAAMRGHEKTVRLLLTKAGVDRNARDNDSYTALMLAVCYRKWEIVRILSENGANFSDIHVLLAWHTEQHTFEIKKNALTNKAQELIANGASLETARKINKITKWAHVWGLTETYTIKDEMNRNVTFIFGGYNRQVMLQTFINYVNKFYESIQHNQHNLTLLKENQVVVQTSIEHALFESSSSSDIDSAIKSSPLLVLLCGWRSHAFSMVVDHSKKQPELMICNRGGGSRKDDHGNAIVKRYAFNDASHVNETTIKKLTKIYDNAKEFGDMISDMISRKILEEVPDDNFVQKLQKAEHCAWANTKGALPLILRICTSKNTGELVRTVVERKDYKEFSAWVRAEALEELLLSNPPRDLVLKFLEKYITKLFGQNISYGERGITRPVKEIIEEIQSPDTTSEMRINGINNLISLLGIENMQNEQAKRQGMQKIRALFETWLKGLRDDILSEVAQEKRS